MKKNIWHLLLPSPLYLLLFFLNLHFSSFSQNDSITARDTTIFSQEEEVLYRAETMPCLASCCKIESTANKEQCTTDQIRLNIFKNFRVDQANKAAINKEIKNQGGLLYVKFIVGKDGKVKDPVVLKGGGPLLRDLAIEAVSSMPQFSPGLSNGKPIAIYYTIPIKVMPLE